MEDPCSTGSLLLTDGQTCCYRGYHRIAGQRRSIFQGSLVLSFLEDAVFSEMELMLVFMNQ